MHSCVRIRRCHSPNIVPERLEVRCITTVYALRVGQGDTHSRYIRLKEVVIQVGLYHTGP